MRKVHPVWRAVFVAPAVLWFCAAVIYPVCMAIYYSMFDWNGITPMVFNGLNNYIEMLRDPSVSRSLINSLKVAFFSVLFQLPLGMSFALLMYNPRVKGRGFFRTLFFLPVILSSAVVGILWSQIYNPNLGLLNALLALLGAQKPFPVWLGDSNLALYCVILVIIWQFIGEYMLIYYMALHNVSIDVMEYASIDGCKPMTLFFKIQLPLIWPVVRLTIILATINSIKYFDLFHIMFNGNNHLVKSEVLATYILRTAFRSMRFGYANTISVLLLVLGVAFLVLNNRLLKANND